MKRVAIGGLILAVVGIGIWYVRDKKDSNGETDPDAPAKTEKLGPVAKKETADATKSNRSRGARELNVLFDDDPVGELVLEGQVIDSSESGVSGAMVSINSNPPQTIRTDDDGSFSIAKLVGRPYQIVARHDDGVAGPLVVKLTDTNDPVILKLRPAAVVKVNVVSLQAGKPISNASVELRGIDRQSTTTDKQGDGRFAQVVPGRYEVVAEARGHAPRHDRVRVGSAGGEVTVKLALKGGAAASGIVVGHDGKPVAGARVVYAGASEWSQRANPRWDAAETNSKGEFEFAALAAGTFRFTARAQGRAPGQSELVTLDGKKDVRDLRVTLGEGAVLSGRVVSTSGAPVPTARVRVRRKDAGFRGGVREVFADDKGSYEIEGLDRMELEVVAMAEEASSDIVFVDFSKSPHKKKQDLSLSIAGVISGIVVDESGAEIEGAQVTAFPDFRENRRMSFRLRGVPRVLTDAGGRFKIAGVEDGSYMVRATRSDAASTAGWLVEPTMAKAGDTDVRIELAELGSIRGKVAFADGQAPTSFTVGMGGWGGGSPFATKDGDFEIPDLAPQKYTMTIRGPGFNSKQLVDVVVKASEATDLGTIAVKKGRVLIGVVLDSNGTPVEDALVRAGKTIFGSGSSSTGTRGGPPGARNTKDTRTDASGGFAISGLPPTDVSIVAEHETLGRSRATLIQNGGQSVTEMAIRLEPYGSLKGKVLKGSDPMPNVRISVSSLTSPDVLFGVASGEDGTFQFDRLAPDEYKISAMVGTNPMQGFGFQSQKTKVESGKTETVTITMATGNLDLVVTIKEKEAKSINFTWVTVVRGAVEATTARALQLEIGREPEGYSSQSFSIAGSPAKIPNLDSGPHTVCATPYPAEVSGMGGTMAYMEREGDNLPTFCVPHEIAQSPQEQEMTLEVTAPEFVPPPDDT